MVVLSELLSLLDGSHGSVDGGAAVVDQVHVGDTRVVDEAARQVHRSSNSGYWPIRHLVYNVVHVDSLAVVEGNQVEFKKNSSHSNQLGLVYASNTSQEQSRLKT